MKYILAILMIELLGCSTNKNDIKHKYYTKSKESFIELDFSDKKNVIGNHCFVFNNGNKIDCCKDFNSLKINLKDKDVYQGNLFSCYDETEYDIIIKVEKDSLVLIFKDEYYPFVISNLVFYPDR